MAAPARQRRRHGRPPGGGRAGRAHRRRVSFANGGDNIGVYVPVFAASGTGALAVYVTVFLVLVAVWCAAGHRFARRPVVAVRSPAGGTSSWPVVLTGIGLVILIEGGAFGL
jgi:cadmium resistance protein CadD (predicted permease)